MMIRPLKAAWQRAELWFWGKFFILLIALGAGTRRRRMSHNNGIAGRGTVRIVANPQFPATEFFEPGLVYPCRLRHGAAGFMDDTMGLVRSASLKFADSDFAGPLDVQMNTGNHCFFWTARSFLEFAFSRHPHDGMEYEEFYRKHAEGRLSAASSLIRPPSSFAQLYYHSHTPFAWRARDGKPRYVRFRLQPEDRGPMSAAPDPEFVIRAAGDPGMARQLADQKAAPDETRNVNYLKNEWRDRVESQGARYHLQIQLHEVSPADSDQVRNSLIPWNESTHPYLDLAEVEITEVLSPAESAYMAFEITNLPASMGILPARSLDDYNSLNYMRQQSIWAIRTRRFLTRRFGPVAPVPDDAPHNLSPKGM